MSTTAYKKDNPNMNLKARAIIKAFTPKQKATFKLLTLEQKQRLLIILLKRSQGTRKPIMKRHKKTPVHPVSSVDAIVNSLDIQ
ncbi:hypothetical protein H6G96_27590 [Nostoc sp. FACHB-892]|uniref:hypothetical protein n=1 Tax=Nostoc sp. FACHB-892 TaxID=2692843 RepID=UPI00168993BB|nr:hypothetical protein [Nostoc sp. FACHB-892]MBD2729982.1 hypothetical protein [Nostoc sp. FACHB-892]